MHKKPEGEIKETICHHLSGILLHLLVFFYTHLRKHIEGEQYIDRGSGGKRIVGSK